jgi:ABC-type nitrate/sulfonate/bicarbonate transport system permease component
MFVALATLAVIGIGLHGLVVSIERRVVVQP